MSVLSCAMRYFVLIACCVTAIPTFAQQKSPVPKESEQSQVADKVRQPFKAAFYAAKSNVEKATLAQKVHSEASTTNDSVQRFVMLRLALDIAKSADDMEAAIAIIKTMDKHYELDAEATHAQLNALRMRRAELAKDESDSLPANEALIVESWTPKPWPDGRNSIEYPLPGEFDAVVLAAGGRYLIFRLPGDSKLVIFDIADRAVIKEIDLETTDAIFAATAHYLFIAYPGSNTIERWSLSDFQRLGSAKLPFQAPIYAMVAGHASDGPILAFPIQGPGAFLDATKMLPVETVLHDRQYKREGAFPDASRAAQVRASANGKAFSIRSTSGSPQGFRTLVFDGKSTDMFYAHDSMGYIAPSDTGDLMFTATGVYTNQTIPFTSNDGLKALTFHIPSVDSDYSVGVVRDDGAKDKKSARINIHVQGRSQPVLTLPEVALRPGQYSDFNSRESLPLDQRVFLNVAAQTLVTLPESNRSVAMYRVDDLPPLSRHVVQLAQLETPSYVSEKKGRRGAASRTRMRPAPVVRGPNERGIDRVSDTVIALHPYCQVNHLGLDWSIEGQHPPTYAASSADEQDYVFVKVEDSVSTAEGRQAFVQEKMEQHAALLELGGFKDLKTDFPSPDKTADNVVQFQLEGLRGDGVYMYWIFRVKFDAPKHTYVFEITSPSKSRAQELVKITDSFKPLVR